MVTISNRLKSIMDYQLLYGSFLTDQSLLNGKSGLSLFFFCCARITNNRFYESFAETESLQPIVRGAWCLIALYVVIILCTVVSYIINRYLPILNGKWGKEK